MRSHTGRGALAWAIFAPALALAEPAPPAEAARDEATAALALRWNDPNGIAPTTDLDFDSRLSERLGHPAFGHITSAPALIVTWLGTSEQCRVELQLLKGSEIEGTRVIESPSGECRALVPALLTVAALLIESRNAEPETEGPPAPPPPEPPHQPSPAPGLGPAASREPLLLASVGAALELGFAPKVELGPAVAVVLTPLPHLRLGLQGSLFLRHQYGALPGLSLGHQSGALVVCEMPLTGALNLGLCGNLALHRWSSTGISLPHPESNVIAEWTTGLGLRAEWRLVNRLWWVGSAGAEVAPRPLYFYFTPPPGGEVVLFRQRAVAPSLFLGLTLELP